MQYDWQVLFGAMSVIEHPFHTLDPHINLQAHNGVRLPPYFHTPQIWSKNDGIHQHQCNMHGQRNFPFKSIFSVFLKIPSASWILHDFVHIAPADSSFSIYVPVHKKCDCLWYSVLSVRFLALRFHWFSVSGVFKLSAFLGGRLELPDGRTSAADVPGALPFPADVVTLRIVNSKLCCVTSVLYTYVWIAL